MRGWLAGPAGRQAPFWVPTWERGLEVDALTRIVVGERTAWSGSRTDSGQIDIDKPSLVGGDDREGGVVGAVDLVMGTASDGRNDYWPRSSAVWCRPSAEWCR
jgi:hypothetical protein